MGAVGLATLPAPVVSTVHQQCRFLNADNQNLARAVGPAIGAAGAQPDLAPGACCGRGSGRRAFCGQLARPAGADRSLDCVRLHGRRDLGIGSLCLGAVAQASTVSTAFFVIAGGLALAAIVTWPLALPASAAGQDLTAEPLPFPAVDGVVEEGPVLVTVEYAVASGNADAFLATASELRRARRRTGATRWHLHRDIQDTGLFTETFLVGSWQEHERQHVRLAREDRDVLDRIDALLRSDRPRTAHHAVGIRTRRRRSVAS